MGTAVRQWQDLESDLQAALRSQKRIGKASPALDSAERIEKGTVSALAIVEAAETAANDIKAAAQSALDAAHVIMSEAEKLASEMLASGQKISEEVKKFAATANRVSAVMRDSRGDLQHWGKPPASDG